MDSIASRILVAAHLPNVQSNMLKYKVRIATPAVIIRVSGFGPLLRYQKFRNDIRWLHFAAACFHVANSAISLQHILVCFQWLCRAALAALPISRQIVAFSQRINPAVSDPPAINILSRQCDPAHTVISLPGAFLALAPLWLGGSDAQSLLCTGFRSHGGPPSVGARLPQELCRVRERTRITARPELHS
jgi:hypothetical protein